MMKRILTGAVSAATLSLAQGSWAVSDAEFEELKAQFAAMAGRVSALEAENQRLKELTTNQVPVIDLSQEDVAALKAHKQSSSWAENVAWKGDFRYRYEEIDAEFADDERTRHRIRARAALVAKLPSNR